MRDPGPCVGFLFRCYSDPGRFSMKTPGQVSAKINMRRPADVAQPFGNVQQIARGAGQAVQPGDDEHVVVAHLVEQPGQLGSVALGAGSLLLIQPPAARLTQRPPLKGEVLVVGADAGVAEEHEIVAEVVAESCRCATHICNSEVPSPPRRCGGRGTPKFRDTRPATSRARPYIGFTFRCSPDPIFAQTVT
jgi:hypothetical protein